MQIIKILKQEFAKSDKNKIKEIMVFGFIFVPLMILYAEYWIEYTVETSNYLLTFRPTIEELTTVQITYWIFSSLSVLISGLVGGFILLNYVSMWITNFITFKMKWKKRNSVCHICLGRLKLKDTIIIKNGKPYHHSCFNQLNNTPDSINCEEELK